MRELLQMLEDLLDAPAAADIVAYNSVKHIAAVFSGWCANLHDPLDLIDAVTRSIVVEALAVGWHSSFSSRCFTPLAPHNCPIEYAIDISQFANGIEPIAGNGQRLVGAAEQFGGNILAVNVKGELPVEALAIRESPDPAAGPGRRHLGIAVAAGFKEVLRPHVDRVSVDVTAIVYVDRSEWIGLGENVGDAVAVAGLHGRQCRS